MKLLKHSRFTTILVTVLSIVAITIATDSTIKTVHANNKRIELKKHKTQVLSKVKKLNLKDVRPAVVNKIKDAKSEKDLNTLLTKAYDLSKSNTQYDNDKIKELKELKETELKKKEEAAKIAKQKAESLKKAENERIEKEKLEQSAQNAAANTDTNTTTESTQPSSQQQQSKIEASTPSSEPTQPQPQPTQTQTQTDGFNLNGYHFNISYFSGTGHVPADNNVYLWTDYTQHPHYLIERMGSATPAIRSANIGTQITINGKTYTVFNIIHGIQNDINAYNALSNGSPAITIQSCDTPDNDSVLTIWYAR